MTDVHSPAKRSYNMSMIRGVNTLPEQSLRKVLWRFGFRYRLSAKLPGRPDLVFPRFKVAIFIDGCFWHGCPRHMTWPKNNAAFWKKKILGNKSRDAIVTRELKRSGWTVVRVWEHEVHSNVSTCALRIQRILQTRG